MPPEYGTGPAELQALQDVAAQWWQDVQHERRQGALPPTEQCGRDKHRDTGMCRGGGGSKVPRGHMAAGTRGTMKGAPRGGTQKDTYICTSNGNPWVWPNSSYLELPAEPSVTTRYRYR